MNIFNRVATIIFALIILAGAVITLLAVSGAALPEEILPWKGATEASGGAEAIAIGVSIVVALGMLAILYFEARPHRERLPLLIKSDEKGVITIDEESVRLLANKIGLTAHNVRDIYSRLKEAPGGLAVNCNATLALGTDIPEIGAELQGKIKEAIEQFTGLPVAQVAIKAHYEAVEARSLIAR